MAYTWTVDANTGCWLWQGYLDRYGYARMSVGSRNGVIAHRRFYELHVGPIPEGMTVDHLCFARSCVNPKHLRLLTRSENSANTRKANATHCGNGHERTAANTHQLDPLRYGNRRQCRRCNADAAARYQERKRSRAVTA